VILRGIPLNEFFDGWGVKLQACVCFSYRFGSVAEIRGGGGESVNEDV